jgi:hypothetical protein
MFVPVQITPDPPLMLPSPNPAQVTSPAEDDERSSLDPDQCGVGRQRDDLNKCACRAIAECLAVRSRDRILERKISGLGNPFDTRYAYEGGRASLPCSSLWPH